MDGVIISATTESIYLQCLQIYFIMVDLKKKKKQKLNLVITESKA